METWLNADKTLILDEALTKDGLAWHDVIAHAFLYTPRAGCKRAKVRHGVSRYSSYVIRVFLVTEGGVREVEAELDFEEGEVGDRTRMKFPFTSVSSLKVEEKDRSHTLSLTLMNGDPKKIHVSEPATRVSEQEVPAEETTTGVDLDASGFSHTRRILEGIAAEGTQWLRQERERQNRARASAPDGSQGNPASEQVPNTVRVEH